jgi:hypothetical protein
LVEAQPAERIAVITSRNGRPRFWIISVFKIDLHESRREVELSFTNHVRQLLAGDFPFLQLRRKIFLATGFPDGRHGLDFVTIGHLQSALGLLVRSRKSLPTSCSDFRTSLAFIFTVAIGTISGLKVCRSAQQLPQRLGPLLFDRISQESYPKEKSPRERAEPDHENVARRTTTTDKGLRNDQQRGAKTQDAAHEK